MLLNDCSSIDFGYDDMHRIIAAGQQAREYAITRFHQLSSRKTVYTLYGPPHTNVGVFGAGRITPPSERIIQLATRRKSYTQYEFDENLNIICVRHIKDYNKLHCTFFVFQEGDFTYAQPFLGDQCVVYPSPTIIFQWKNERPSFFAESSLFGLCVEFYEYPAVDRIKTTGYLYHPCSKYTSWGAKTSWSVPMNSTTSPVTTISEETAYRHICFRDVLRNRQGTVCVNPNEKH